MALHLSVYRGRVFSFIVLFAATVTLCCSAYAIEQPFKVYPPAALTNGVEVRVNQTVMLKFTVRLDTDTATDNNLSFYYEFNNSLWDSLIAPISNSYELVEGVFSSRLQEVRTNELNNEEHTKSLELSIHGVDRENYRNFTISFAVFATGHSDAEYKTDPIRVIVVDDPVTETTSSETTTDTSTIDNAYDFEDIVKKAQQKVEEAQRKSTTLQYALIATIGVVVFIMSVLLIILIVYSIKRRNKKGGSGDVESPGGILK